MSDSLDKEKQPLLVAGPVFSEGSSEGFKRTAYDPNVCGGVAVLREYLHSFLFEVGAEHIICIGADGTPTHGIRRIFVAQHKLRVVGQ
jgi:hypothetical protein